jgi:hypothetical protein
LTLQSQKHQKNYQNNFMIIYFNVNYPLMTIKSKTYSSVMTMAIVAIVTSSDPFVFAQLLSNQTGNDTVSNKSNSTANNGSIRCSDSELTHLGAAIQSFLFRDENKALMHMNEANKTLTGAAKMFLDAAINALQSGDTNRAKEYLGSAQYACGIPDPV